MIRSVIDLTVGDISPDWKGSTAREQQIIERLTKLDGTPRAALFLAKHAHELSDYWYWYCVGVCWVCYSGFVELGTWRRLFTADRPNRRTSLMKPSELTMLDRLPSEIVAFRAHRPGETDWIAYTMDPGTAARFARKRGIGQIAVYSIAKEAVVALFARRAEAELIVVDSKLARERGVMAVLT